MIYKRTKSYAEYFLWQYFLRPNLVKVVVYILTKLEILSTFLYKPRWWVAGGQIVRAGVESEWFAGVEFAPFVYWADRFMLILSFPATVSQSFGSYGNPLQLTHKKGRWIVIGYFCCLLIIWTNWSTNLRCPRSKGPRESILCLWHCQTYFLYCQAVNLDNLDDLAK